MIRLPNDQFEDVIYEAILRALLTIPELEEIAARLELPVPTTPADDDIVKRLNLIIAMLYECDRDKLALELEEAIRVKNAPDLKELCDLCEYLASLDRDALVSFYQDYYAEHGGNERLREVKDYYTREDIIRFILQMRIKQGAIPESKRYL